MVATGFLRLVRTLVARTWPLHVQGMHRRVYGVVECKSGIFIHRDIPNTSPGNISSKSRVTTQRCLSKLAGGYYTALEYMRFYTSHVQREADNKVC